MLGYAHNFRIAALSAIVAAGLTIASALTPLPVQAQQRDRCNDYANQVISYDQRARQMRCTGWASSSNYQGHFDWCAKRAPQAAEKALADWGTAFQRCQFKASGSPAAGAGRPASNIHWVQLGGSWRSGVYRVDTDRCTHGAPGSYCGPGQDWRGQYSNGAVTQWRKGGCKNPIISIQCVVRPAP